jgi:mannitol-1-/sugar-/sorbitol-6-/2-deoxyglucose-6-phosphatase
LERARPIIFDMDGLLIDSEPLWVRAEIEVFARVGLRLTAADCARTKGLRIDDVVAYWHAQTPRGFAAERGTGPSVSLAAVETSLIDRVAELVGTEGRALPGALGAVRLAREHGHPIALASSSPTRIIRAALDRLGLSSAFDVVRSAESETHGKPHPAIFLRTAESLAVPPPACLVLEDSLTGVIAAKAARMTCLAVPEGHPNHDPRFVLADVVLGSLDALSAAHLET